MSVVVVAFHRAMALAALLRDLDSPNVDVIVVNVEADRSVSRVCAAAREVSIVDNVGYAAAVNLGVERVETDVVVFMNDDVALTSEAVLALADVVASGDADVAVPKILLDDGAPERTIAALPTPRSLLVEWALLPDEPVRGVGRLIRVEKWRLPSAPARIDAAAAIVVTARTDLVREVPLPDAYFLYWEEMEWFWRLRERRVVVEFRPDVTAVHRGGRADVRADKSRLLARNAVRCVRRTQGRTAALLAVVVVALWNLRLVVVAAVRLLLSPTGREQKRVLSVRSAGLGAAVRAWRETA